jgi:hypothetical protein
MAKLLLLDCLIDLSKAHGEGPGFPMGFGPQ